MVYYFTDMTLQQMIKFDEEINRTVPDDSITFDFSKVSNFDLLTMLTVFEIIRRYEGKYHDVSFYIEGLKDWEKSCCIPITPIFFDNLQKREFEQGIYLEMGNVIEKEASRLSQSLDHKNAELHKLLTFLIREMLRNTPEHAKVRKAWICARNIESSDYTEIAVADEGIGVFKSITSNHNHREYIKDNATALQWVLKAGISKAFSPSQKQRSENEWANSGFGLYMVSRICLSLNGSFTIISNKNYLEMTNNQIKQGETSFCGTALKIRLRSKYIVDAQSIISRTAKNGEAEAKTIRNSFKSSSVTSRGLMNELNIE